MSLPAAFAGAPTSAGPLDSLALEGPVEAGYRLTNLLHFHRRLRPPVPAHEPETAVVEADLAGDAGARGLSAPRRHSPLRLESLRLDDLYGGTLSPVSLLDFESFLTFEEHAVELLYFDAWLRAYSVLYDATPRSRHSAAELQASFNFALATFLHPSSLLELNTSAAIRTDLDAAVAVLPASAREAFLPPAQFAPLHAEVHDALHDSLIRFLKHQRGNGGRERGWLALAIGAVAVAVGWVPCAIGVGLDGQRGWRALGLPFFFLGVVVFYGGLFNTCLVIFTFAGDGAHLARQRFRWELALHRSDPPSLFATSSSTLTHSLSCSTAAFKEVKPSHTLLEHGSPAVHILRLDPSADSTTPASSCATTRPPTARLTPFGLAHFPAPNPADLTLPPRFGPYEVHGGGVDGLDWSGPGVGVCGPMVTVESPLVREWQRRIIVRGCVAGVVGAVVCGAVALSVPVRG